MKPLTREWVAKAEGDLHSCLRETRARKNANYDSACFHAQQCVEKYLKARLQEAGAPIPKTHNLEDLLNRLLAFEPRWATLKPTLINLSNTIRRPLHDYRLCGPNQRHTSGISQLIS